MYISLIDFWILLFLTFLYNLLSKYKHRFISQYPPWHRPDEDEGFDEGYFRRRPKSFCAENRRFGGAAVDPAIRLSQISGLDEVYVRSLAMVSAYV